MTDERPDPDKLLAHISDKNEKQDQGRLKIFFGYAAGVGKTFAMLEAAHEAKKAGVDVIAGYIEPHTRPATLALLNGLEQLDPLLVEHKGIVLKEFDLDMAMKRKPELILVDELAHTNADECRHIKRYQDIEELLKAGIHVYTTVNVQHIESLNDIVASITGVVVRERIPDSVFDSADQVKLVDIEPDDLIERLTAGKIYKQQQAQKALGNFFIRENLIALREIALRRTADRVNRTAEKEKKITSNSEYYTEEHIMICLSSSPSNEKVIRTAARMADAFHGSFTALFVDSSDSSQMDEGNKKRLNDNLKLAQQLGAKITTVFGDDVPSQISEYAKASAVSKIVIGRSNSRRRGFGGKQSLVEKLTYMAPNIDIYIIPDTNNNSSYINKRRKLMGAFQFSIIDLGKTLAMLGATTLIALWFYRLGFSEANIITVYILGVLLTAISTKGRGYSIITSLASVLVFNFLFTEPRFTFQAYDSGYPVTFGVMFTASFICSTLAMRVKNQARLSALKSYRTEILLENSQMLQRAKNKDEIYSVSAKQLVKLLDRPVILYKGGGRDLEDPVIFNRAEDEALTPENYTNADENAVAQWVYKNNKHAGATTNTLPGAKCLYMAVRSHDVVFAVVAIAVGKEEGVEAFEKNLLVSMLGECALALEKEQINESNNELAMEARQEQLRANLLRAISHDLRTPLTCISGNAGILRGNSKVLSDDKKQELYTDIYDDSMWLINLVENLLSVTRIENGTMSINMQSELLEEVISEALAHINRKKTEHNILVDVKEDLLMAKMDSRLIVQVIINIVDNAIKYTSVGSDILVAASRQGDDVLVEIKDNGNGIANEVKEKIFDMFYTANNSRGDSRRGMGLGLTLCKSIIEAHGGTISVQDNIPTGTNFCFTLQAEEVNYSE